MSTISTNFNTQNENITFPIKNDQFEETKENLTPRSSTFMGNEQSRFMQPNIRMGINKEAISLTSQVEEYAKIQSEIKYINFINISDTKSLVETLSLSKMSKFRKMEDLRKLIERVAEEDTYRCRYLDNHNNRYFISDKSSNSLSSQRYKVNNNIFCFNNIFIIIQKESFPQFNQKKVVVKSDFDNRNSVTNSSTAQISRSSETAESLGGASEVDRAPGKQGIQGSKGKRAGVCKEGPCDTDEHFNNLYCFWQDNLCLPLHSRNSHLLCSK